MDGKLFEFSCMTFNSNQELLSFIDNCRLKTIFSCLDKSNNLFSKMKEYEGKDKSELFEDLLNEYLQNKEVSLTLADMLMEINKKDKNDSKYQELLEIYKNTLKKQKLLPIDNKVRI